MIIEYDEQNCSEELHEATFETETMVADIRRNGTKGHQTTDDFIQTI